MLEQKVIPSTQLSYKTKPQTYSDSFAYMNQVPRHLQSTPTIVPHYRQSDIIARNISPTFPTFTKRMNPMIFLIVRAPQAEPGTLEILPSVGQSHGSPWLVFLFQSDSRPGSYEPAFNSIKSASHITCEMAKFISRPRRRKRFSMS